MPPRTGPRAKRRPKIGAPRHFVIIHTSTWMPDLVTAHRLELSEGNLVLHDHNDAIGRILARGEWREIRPATMADMELPAPPNEPDERREQATLTNENDPAIPKAPIREEGLRSSEEARFVPSSPEEAQRILMEIERRLAPDYQDPPEDAPPTPLRKD